MSDVQRMRFHHIGYLVADLAIAQQHWKNALGYELCGEVIHDAGQQARVCLLRNEGEFHWVELISPDSDASHLHRALQRKVSLHHVAYEVANINAAAAQLRQSGCIPLGKAVIGAAFGRPIMWFHDPMSGLVELVAAGEGPYQLS
ncbi:VOC family protein [Cerasicoccus maritimus]|uniref:VOC family protein n=1 Tax=Cerasicoccus maritimus TaxID=490089 RepID=UPI002852C217|nr:VOC family protein [Cerasicoccus maritimus]